MINFNIRVVKVVKNADKEETTPLTGCKVAALLGGKNGSKTPVVLSSEKGSAPITLEKGKYLKCILVDGKRYDGHYLPDRPYTINVY